MVNVVKDLKEGDLAKEEVAILNEQITLQNLYIEQSDSLQKVLKAQALFFINANDEKDGYLTAYKLRLEKADRNTQKQSSWIKGLGIALVVSIASNLITK
jgi:hypothetical protein